ncbi:MAG: hypothetical protein UV24_C0030G0003 [Candidatus Nomurabacteria bacterium GW2011_GWA2_42_41]|nr:MAG: hypothetical protein UV24_C0030G0003 [Candidatus Nomurabacteria bacterium GW2011_GWA2_42_41]
MEIVSNKDLYQTSDIALASVLLSYGLKLEAVDKRNPKAIFLFQKEKGVEQLAEGFWSHNLQVDPLLYFNSLKELKTRLYQTIS